MELVLLLSLVLPGGVAAHRLAAGRRFPALAGWVVAASLGQVFLPAAAFALSAGGLRLFTSGRGALLAGFFEVGLAWLICYVTMWGLFLTLGVACWLKPTPGEGPGKP